MGLGPTADPRVASLIPAPSFHLVEIDHGKISTVILLLPHVCCQLKVKECVKLAQEKEGLFELTISP